MARSPLRSAGKLRSLDHPPAAADEARPSLREEQRSLTRRRLMEAARDLFHEKNYVVTTVDDIATRAGVGRATFYLHYTGKEAILRDLWDETLGHLERLYRRLAAMPDPSEAQLTDWVSLHLRAFKADQRSLSLFNLVSALDTSLVAERARFRDRCIAILGKTIPAFQVDDADPAAARETQVAANLLLYQLEQFSFYQSFPGWEADAETGCRLLARSFREFIRKGSAD